MTDTRKQAEKTATNFNDDQNNRARRQAESPTITSLAYRSNRVHIGTSGDAYQFDANVYIGGGGKKVKQSTVERFKRRERQKARRAAGISDSERKATREAQHQEWQARQERKRKENESRWKERDRKEGRNLSEEEHIARDLVEEKEKAGKKIQRPLTSFFKPVVHGSQNVDCGASEAAGTSTDISMVYANGEDDRVEEQGATVEDCIEEESTFKPSKVFT